MAYNYNPLMKNSKGKIYKFLRENDTLTLATVSEKGKPEAASMRYVVDGDNILLFVTNKSYRKYRNLLANPEVACVVTAERLTLQFDAMTQEVSGPLAEDTKQKIIEVLPEQAQYMTEDTRFFTISPTWMRMQDYNKRPVEQCFYELDN
jgi:uncharacterized pyridoxamine 5'-phosphate oxidase family protein